MHIEADTHCHTVASTHAYSTVRELALCAAEAGLKAIAITDHAPASPDSPHIWHFINMDCIPKYINNVLILKGAEANIIDYEGNIDLDTDVLSCLDWVVASMHSAVIRPLGIEQHSNAYIKAAQNPYIDVIGHSTTVNFPFEYEKVLKTFKEYGKLVEINESSLVVGRSSAEIVRNVLDICKKFEIPIIVNSDCHYCEVIGVVENAKKIIESMNFPEELIVNGKLERLLEYIENKRKLKQLDT